MTYSDTQKVHPENVQNKKKKRNSATIGDCKLCPKRICPSPWKRPNYLFAIFILSIVFFLFAYIMVPPLPIQLRAVVLSKFKGSNGEMNNLNSPRIISNIGELNVDYRKYTMLLYDELKDIINPKFKIVEKDKVIPESKWRWPDKIEPIANAIHLTDQKIARPSITLYSSIKNTSIDSKENTHEDLGVYEETTDGKHERVDEEDLNAILHTTTPLNSALKRDKNHLDVKQESMYDNAPKIESFIGKPIRHEDNSNIVDNRIDKSLNEQTSRLDTLQMKYSTAMEKEVAKEQMDDTAEYDYEDEEEEDEVPTPNEAAALAKKSCRGYKLELPHDHDPFVERYIEKVLNNYTEPTSKTLKMLTKKIPYFHSTISGSNNLYSQAHKIRRKFELKIRLSLLLSRNSVETLWQYMTPSMANSLEGSNGKVLPDFDGDGVRANQLQSFKRATKSMVKKLTSDIIPYHLRRPTRLASTVNSGNRYYDWTFIPGWIFHSLHKIKRQVYSDSQYSNDHFMERAYHLSLSAPITGIDIPNKRITDPTKHKGTENVVEVFLDTTSESNIAKRSLTRHPSIVDENSSDDDYDDEQRSARNRRPTKMSTDKHHKQVTINRMRGSTIKIILELAGGQHFLFKPKRSNMADLVEERFWPAFHGRERFQCEILSFHLARVLEFRKTPITIGRKLHLLEELVPNDKSHIIREVSQNGDNEGSYCFRLFKGKKLKKRLISKKMCTDTEGYIEGAAIMWLPFSLGIIKNPWHPKFWSKRIKSCDAYQMYDTSPEQCSKNVEVLMKQNPKLFAVNQKDMLLDIIDLSIFDFLIDNIDRSSFEYLVADQKSSRPKKGVNNVYFGGNQASASAIKNEKISSNTLPFSLVMLDSGNCFPDPKVDTFTTLAPLYQCCKLRKSTYERLKELKNGRFVMLFNVSLSADPLHPFMGQAWWAALERRYSAVLNIIEQWCFHKYGYTEVLVP